MDQEITFSIITICWNSLSHLEDAMQSVLATEDVELEYLLIDGGSTDGTVEMIRSAAEQDSRIRWVSEPDEGIADAFNKGLAMATGDWIGILNSDDCYAPGALTSVVDVVAENPEADIIHGNMQRIDGEGRPLFILKPGRLDHSIWHDMPLNHPATFVKRLTYETFGQFDPQLKVAMDYDLILRFFLKGCRFVHVDKVLACMRYGGTSDENLLSVAKEVYSITTRQGYSRVLAGYWLILRLLKGYVKRVLRGVGLHSLLKLHPRFFNSSTPEK